MNVYEAHVVFAKKVETKLSYSSLVGEFSRSFLELILVTKSISPKVSRLELPWFEGSTSNFSFREEVSKYREKIDTVLRPCHQSPRFQRTSAQVLRPSHRCVETQLHQGFVMGKQVSR
ncbi:Uncharacterized protein TCM_036678 [Theobroma cacao]|uniref:Uncharacterized protein n=1 Tax=Theobroma cacao TaxID=3641 RepID=A0A061FSH3_THECC|nr:Uncharacterized protein TCM_036678 [Theobroma cacao]